jgi:glycerol-3-phosphate dehydrogenase
MESVRTKSWEEKVALLVISANPAAVKTAFVDVSLLVTVAALEDITVILTRNVRKKRKQGILAKTIINATPTFVKRLVKNASLTQPNVCPITNVSSLPIDLVFSETRFSNFNFFRVSLESI